MKMYLPVLRADLEVIETYSYSPEEPLACSMSVFGGYDDKTVRIDDLEAWRSMVSEGFNLRMFEGNHFFPRTIRQPFLDAVVEALRPFLSSQ
jgi:surfactin synthase thioesterase subunit